MNLDGDEARGAEKDDPSPRMKQLTSRRPDQRRVTRLSQSNRDTPSHPIALSIIDAVIVNIPTRGSGFADRRDAAES